MRKPLACLILAFFAALASAEESWIGLYMGGSKIGYEHSLVVDTTLNKAPAKRSDSTMVMNSSLLGQSLTMKMDSTSWLDQHGKPILMKFKVESGGRVETLDALFTTKSIVVDIDNSGAKSTRTITMPSDAGVVDDALGTVLEHGYKPGLHSFFYVLNPMTVQLDKSEITLEGRTKTTVHGKVVMANKVEIKDPDTVSYAYLTAKGDLVKFEGPMGIEGYPETRAEALKESSTRVAAKTDLAFSTSLKPDKAIPDVQSVRELNLKITGHDLSALPSDAHQTVTRKGSSWLVDLHPVTFSSKTETAAEAAAQKPDWVKPGLNIPSDSSTFKQLATELTQGATSVRDISGRIRAYVYGAMKPNAGIGVLRDASEILRTKEGVCRDYAVLTATLLRASGVPAKLVSGLVYEEGSFYYHAWVEVWDGSNWVGVDSTLPSGKVTAGHIQLAEGNVEQAFTFPFLDKVRVEVLNVRRA